MLRINIRQKKVFDFVIGCLYSGWVLEHMHGNWITLRIPFPSGPYR